MLWVIREEGKGSNPPLISAWEVMEGHPTTDKLGGMSTSKFDMYKYFS